MTPRQFERLDRVARLTALAEVAHHSGIESDEYRALARKHQWLCRCHFALTESQTTGE
jgi:hypothetical protein